MSTNPYLQKNHVCLNKRYITSIGSASMAFSTMIGTAKETIHFSILVFLGTQEMNLWGNLKDSKCDILHIFMRAFFVLRKSSFPLLTLFLFFRSIFTLGTVMLCETDPLFSNATTLQSRLSDFSKHRLQEKCFLLGVLQ